MVHIKDDNLYGESSLTYQSTKQKG